ncbi:minor tail protein [Arthrobacter phage SWEP2]|uniref:Minor tail protein n=1 Tax=Arthrobacter phage SWEP2 TaxID=2945958 RepID=A0A9E7MI97_9CAUD|nr:minor tail protein [Arthrobacter phage SWEP2]
MTPQIRLTAARNRGDVVTVYTSDGRVRTGQVVDTMTGGPFPMAVQSADVQFPMYFHPEDVVDVRDPQEAPRG